MLTIARLTKYSIKYYNDTADQARQADLDRQTANGGLAEYYSEGETRIPTWLVVGDRDAIGQTTGLTTANSRAATPTPTTSESGSTTAEAPNGATGREFTDTSVHGFDLTFAAPKSVSLIRALTDDVAEKVLAAAHTKAVARRDGLPAPARRLHPRATTGSPATSDLQRLPGLVAIAYQHETSRCGDPHLHTHVIVPNRQPRADGQLCQPRLQEPAPRSQGRRHHLPSHPAPRTARRARLRMARRSTRTPGWPKSPASTRDSIKAWSQRSTRLREWARNNLTVVDGEPTAAQLAAAQKATRPAKPESLAWAELKEQWRADARGLRLDRDAHFAARAERRAARRSTRWTGRASPRWPRTSTNPRSPAPTWSNSSARNCPSTRPATRAR